MASALLTRTIQSFFTRILKHGCILRPLLFGGIRRKRKHLICDNHILHVNLKNILLKIIEKKRFSYTFVSESMVLAHGYHGVSHSCKLY